MVPFAPLCLATAAPCQLKCFEALGLLIKGPMTPSFKGEKVIFKTTFLTCNAMALEEFAMQ